MLIKALSPAILARMHARFSRLYGPAAANACNARLAALVGRYGVGYNLPPAPAPWDEATAVLITYADSVQRPGELPLETLRLFAEQHLANAFSTIHLLPFFPWSSDDGFSVIDYRQVHAGYGKWSHVEALGKQFGLMFDLVLNHASAQSSWFKHYVANTAPYRRYFIEADPAADLSATVRPRNLPLLTEVSVNGSKKHLWTTFGPDQIDLDFSNPDVLFEFLDILLLYVSRGARIIRLDAIAYLWKQPGTACIHLEQTHEIVKLMRDLIDLAAPHVVLLTETNVPHMENTAYFGQGDEARMVYQFSLPPLLLHALQTQNTRHLAEWAQTTCTTPAGCTWFNFTASHDGIGVRPLAGLVPDEEIDALVRQILALGGQCSTKRNADGTESPYELNITYFDAMGGDGHQIDRFLCSQTIMLALKGIPGVYLHSLTATRNDTEGFAATGRARSLNRKKWDADELETLLRGSSPTARVFTEYVRRLGIRKRHPAFHPDAAQHVVDLGPEFFAFVRSAPHGQAVFCISNCTAALQELHLDGQIPELSGPDPATDLLSGLRLNGLKKVVELAPYQSAWLVAE